MSRHSNSLPLSHPGVVCTVEDYGDRMFVFYWGTPQDLIAAGCASEQSLFGARSVRNSVYLSRAKGVERRDDDGDSLHVDKYASGRWRVMRVKPRALAVHLPGVEMYLRTIAEMGMTQPYNGCSSWRLGEEPRQPLRPSYLRLVVDNTQRA
jgi:hypothetical protein